MALQTSGQISLNDVNVELGNSGTAQIDMNSAAVRGLFGIASGQIAMSNGYGKANEFVLSSGAIINGQSNLQEITISNYISSGETLRVPSGFWVWSDNVSNPAMIIDIPCTIINDGKIIGKGGHGGEGPYSAEAGGPAIRITSSGVTVTNSSGSYIAGGGGGAGGHFYNYRNARGGGGAGGGDGGSDPYKAGTAGGILNAASASGSPGSGGGGAGGAGGGYQYNAFPGGNNQTAAATGGGRILPGVGGIGYINASNGGSAGNNGDGSYYSGGGGGGWGAQGGYSMQYNNTGSDYGAAGGDAIDDNGNSYTLTNSGTIYGAI